MRKRKKKYTFWVEMNTFFHTLTLLRSRGYLVHSSSGGEKRGLSILKTTENLIYSEHLVRTLISPVVHMLLAVIENLHPLLCCFLPISEWLLASDLALIRPKWNSNPRYQDFLFLNTKLNLFSKYWNNDLQVIFYFFFLFSLCYSWWITSVPLLKKV